MAKVASDTKSGVELQKNSVTALRYAERISVLNSALRMPVIFCKKLFSLNTKSGSHKLNDRKITNDLPSKEFDHPNSLQHLIHVFVPRILVGHHLLLNASCKGSVRK